MHPQLVWAITKRRTMERGEILLWFANNAEPSGPETWHRAEGLRKRSGQPSRPGRTSAAEFPAADSV